MMTLATAGSLRVIATAVAVVVSGIRCGPSASSQTSRINADSSIVANLVHARLRAALAGDTAEWHRFVSDSCLWTGGALRVSATREVLPSIAANRVLRPAAQQITELLVYVSGDVAQATYVQQVQDRRQSAEAGKRFRKVDTFVRRGASWLLIGATEIAVSYRPRVVPTEAAMSRLVGRYALRDVDTLTVAATSPGRFTMRGRDGTVDTLLVENDSTLFIEGDAGSWIFRGTPVHSLVYRATGAADIMLPRRGPQVAMRRIGLVVFLVAATSGDVPAQTPSLSVTAGGSSRATRVTPAMSGAIRTSPARTSTRRLHCRRVGALRWRSEWSSCARAQRTRSHASADCPQSVRSAMIGSTALARRAGM